MDDWGLFPKPSKCVTSLSLGSFATTRKHELMKSRASFVCFPHFMFPLPILTVVVLRRQKKVQERKPKVALLRQLKCHCDVHA